MSAKTFQFPCFLLGIGVILATSAFGAPGGQCGDVPTHSQLRAALEGVVDAGGNAGLAFQMWGTIVNRDGEVCAVAFTGNDRGDQWPGSRVISAQKANTANAFSLAGLPLSTANLYSAVQPGGTLFGLQDSNPVDTKAAYGGNSSNYGQLNDPMKGEKIGGVNVFGGGLALYTPAGVLIGALGVSGDTSCTDHIIAWKLRHALNLDNVPGGPDTDSNTDNIIYTDGTLDGFEHPECFDTEGQGDHVAIGNDLPTTHPLGPEE